MELLDDLGVLDLLSDVVCTVFDGSVSVVHGCPHFLAWIVFARVHGASALSLVILSTSCGSSFDDETGADVGDHSGDDENEEGEDGS